MNFVKGLETKITADKYTGFSRLQLENANNAINYESRKLERRLYTKLCTRGRGEMLGVIRIGVRPNEENIKQKDRTVSSNVFICKRQVWRNVTSAALKKIVLEANTSILNTIFMPK